MILVRQMRARPILAMSALVGVLTAFLLPLFLDVHVVTRLIIAWNAGAWLYIVLAAVVMLRSNQAAMQRRASLQDEGQLVILAGVVLAAVASLAAIAAGLSVAKQAQGSLKAGHIALAALTIASSWLFTHIMFALHYAHDYYVARGRGEKGGLSFPNDEQPDYRDFLYFSFIIGTSAQTADVSFTSKAMRRIGLVHCVLAFVFNTSLLALMINIAAGLF